MENVPCEVFMNETKIEINLMEEKDPNLQTQEIFILEDVAKIIKLQLKKLINQRKKWKGHNNKMHYVDFFLHEC
jgi:hypothetical protein